MTPDRTNYEIWLIDYLDGNLNPSQTESLLLFLDQNPDIREEFEALSHYNIKPVGNSFPNKNQLKKSVSDLSGSQFELLCIAAGENDLSEPHLKELELIISENSEKKETYEIIKRLKLVAPLLKFNKKSVLRKLTTGQKILRLSIASISVAAGITLMISLFNLPSDNKGDLEALTTAYRSGDSIETKTNSVRNTLINNASEKKDKPDSDRINNISKLKLSSSGDNDKIFPAKSINTDTLVLKPEIQSYIISKIAFKQDVELGEKEFAGTLIAINIIGRPLAQISERPGFNAFIAKMFREKIYKSKIQETGSLKAYEIADAGINGLNKILGWQMSLQKTRDEKGDLKSLYFSSKILKFNAPVKKIQLGP